MALASTSLQQFRIIVESAFGATPVAGNPFNLRMTSQALNFAFQTQTSQEIRSDRQITDLVQVGASSSGAINFELSYNEFDPLIEAALQGTWAPYGTAGVGATFTANFTATTITAAVAPTGGSAFTTLAKGQWFKLTAPSHANDGMYFQVSKSVAPTSTIVTVETATPLAVGTTVLLCKLSSSRLVNGVTQRSFSQEVQFSDIGQFFNYRGMVASKLSLNFASGAIVTGSFDMMGKDAVRGIATALPGSPIASQAFDVMNAVSGVGQVMEGGALLTGTFIKSMKLSVDNKLRGQTAIGVLGNAGIGSGTVAINGDIEVYLADGTMYDKFRNNTATSLSVRTVDGAGNGYIFQLPKVKYGDAKVNAGGMDNDVMLSMPFTALMDNTLTNQTILIDRVGVAAVR